MPTGVMMKSVSVNNADEDICFHVIVDNGVTWWHKHQLRTIVKENGRHTIVFHVFDESWIKSYPKIGSVKDNYMTKATYYRLMVTKMLPENIDRVIYLDGDIIVDRPLSYFQEVDLTGKSVACVTDMSEDMHDYDRLGYDKKLGYFNAGVLVINLKYWREHHVIDEFMDIILKQPNRIKFHDQDVLNIVFCRSKLCLPLDFNLQNGFLYKKDLMELDFTKYRKAIEHAIVNPFVIHYSCSLKPWHMECDHPLKDVWMRYRELTRWKKNKLVRKYPIPLKSKIGNLLRKYNLKAQLPVEIKENRYISI